jgi:hypothetical protein
LNELQKKLSDEVEELSRGRQSGEGRAQQLDNYARNLARNATPQSQEQGQAATDGYGYRLGVAEDRGGQMRAGGAGYGGAMGGGMPGGTTPGFGGYGLPALNAPQPGAPASGPQATDPFGSQAGTGIATDGAALAISGERIEELAAGLASLDVAIPQRGRMYRFTTPRGDLEITARSIPVAVLSRLYGLVAVLLAVCAVSALMTRRARQTWALLANSTVAALALAVLGLLSIVLGIFPVAGLLAVAGGIVIAIRSRIAPARERAMLV